MGNQIHDALKNPLRLRRRDAQICRKQNREPTKTEEINMSTNSIEIVSTDGSIDESTTNGDGAPDLLHLAEKLFIENETRNGMQVSDGAQHPFPQGDFVRFYGLRENPFSDAVNPAYFYKTESHSEALNRMVLAVEHNTSLGMITGLSGTGKTLVTQLLLQHFDQSRYQTILVLVSPGLSKTGLVREILSELGVAVPEGAGRTHDLLRVLSNYIIDLHEQGRRLVLVIDECHLLTADSTWCAQ